MYHVLIIFVLDFSQGTAFLIDSSPKKTVCNLTTARVLHQLTLQPFVITSKGIAQKDLNNHF